MRILVLGDSHARAFSSRQMREQFPDHDLEVVSVGGATASGLPNPNSSTQTLAIFRDHLRAARPDAIVTLLGEVDTGFVIWFRAAKYGHSVNAMLDLAVRNYAGLLAEIADTAKLIVISAPLPTIADGADWGEVANARREVTASQIERTRLTLRFNRDIKSVCLRRGYSFLDLDTASLGPDELVDKMLLNADPADHHYDETAYCRIMTPPLRKILAALEAAASMKSRGKSVSQIWRLLGLRRLIG